MSTTTQLPRGTEEGRQQNRERYLKQEAPRADWGALLRAYLDSHRRSLIDSLSRLFSQPLGSFFTCLAMGVALSLPMGMALLLENVEQLGGSWQRAARISVYLDMAVADVEGQALREQIAGMPGVLEAGWISREQGLAELEKLSGMGDALRELPENPLPSVIQVTPAEVDKGALESMRQKLSALPGVEQAQLDLQWVERLSAIIALGRHFVFGLSVLLVVTLLLVIGNTIRLHIENRREEIAVIKMVGGTDGYVRRPFLYTGTLYGFGAGLFAWLVLVLSLDWLNGAVVSLAGLYGSNFALGGVPLEDGLSLLASAMLLGWVGAWLAATRHLYQLAPR